MTAVQMLIIFWGWGNHDLNYYKTFVTSGAITIDDFKKITGETLTSSDDSTNNAS